MDVAVVQIFLRRNCFARRCWAYSHQYVPLTFLADFYPRTALGAALHFCRAASPYPDRAFFTNFARNFLLQFCARLMLTSFCHCWIKWAQRRRWHSSMQQTSVPQPTHIKKQCWKVFSRSRRVRRTKSQVRPNPMVHRLQKAYAQVVVVPLH